MKENRLNRVLDGMKEQGLSQMIITSPASIFYLTGKWIHPGERMLGLFIDNKGNNKLVINKLFPVIEDLGVDMIWYEDTENPVEKLIKFINKEDAIGIDKDWPARFLLQLINNNAATGYVNGSLIIDRVRMIKDEEEIQLMRESSKINDRAMEKLWKHVKPGVTEKQLEEILAKIYEEEGAEGFSFSPIIATSPNGANPHYETGKDVIKEGDSIVIDMGGLYNSYCSDMTRTVFVGKEPSAEHRKIYNIVKEANEKAISIIKEGVKFSEIDNAARSVITEAGYGEFFTHRTGHSIGIEVHDFGDVSGINHEEVKAGMIFSVEPGIYLADNIGVRIEDLVLVTKDGCEILNSVSKEVTVI